MKPLRLLFLYAAIITCPKLYGQNVGINNSSPEGALDVYGDIILRSADLVAADGVTTALDINNNRFSYYRVTGPTALFTVAGITAGVEGRLITLFNRSGFTMELTHNDPAAALTNRIITGTNTTLEIPDRGIVNLQYDGAEQRWVVLSHNKPTGSTVSGGWGLSGNAGTNPATDFIGTTDNTPLVLRSLNNTVASFQFGFPSNNYIGTNFQRTGIGIIGTGAPTHTLEVGLADLAGGSQGVLGIRGTSFMSHFNYGAEENIYIRGGKNGSHILLNDLNGLGNVGIGMSVPEYKLHIRSENESTVKIDGQNSLVLFHDKTSNAQYGFIRAWTDAPFNPAGYYGLEIGVPPVVGGDPPKRLLFSTNYALRMVIMENGNVGIGTTNPDPYYKLSVNGNVRAKEIRVNSNWADYVFEDNYRLRPLTEVETFIRQHKHLPGIKDAKSIQEEGLDLSSMQTKMMEKIEELTLYLIEANKKIEKLTAEMNILKQQ